MKRSFAIVLLILLMAIIAGCGGDGGPAASPFAGRWVGAWSADGADGTSDITIANDGSMLGTQHDNGSEANGPIAGTIADNGATTFTVSYPSNPVITWTGTFAIQGNGHLVGTVTTTGGFTLEYDLVKQ